MCGFLGVIGAQLTKDTFTRSFATIAHRGPDHHEIRDVAPGVVFGFHRLSIRDTSERGHQPFYSGPQGWTVMCNGEIYNYASLKSRYAKKHSFLSQSDCEVLLPLLADKKPVAAAQALDAEFAFLAYHHATGEVVAARDPVGIRPLFWGRSAEGLLAFASEAKALHEICEEVYPFPPGHVYTSKGGFERYCDLTQVTQPKITSAMEAKAGIRKYLVEAVEKRLHSDVPVGFLLSGGLDSSLVCSIAARMSDKPIRTFAVGIREDAIDIKYAEQVAKHIGSEHTNVYFTVEEAFEVLPKVVRHLETWDITTIRAAIGMYLVCKHIREKTDIRVVLTGEVSDEIFGYKYTDFAPSPEAFQEEAEKRLRELYLYDVLRADRSIAAHSLEARVPFADLDFVRHVMAIDPKLKMNTTGKGKYLLRMAFAEDDFLPYDLLMREKAAFSDAVGHSMVDHLKARAEEMYSASSVKEAKLRFSYMSPFTKESLMYRELFESMFEGRSAWIPAYWMPNKEWENCNVDDPSARVLPNYGQSGS